MTHYTITRWQGKINTRQCHMISEQEFSFDSFQEALDKTNQLALGTTLTELICGDVTHEWVNGQWVGQKL